jgi:FKBP-type peptidyl-prolyl cis-trans isomerase
MAAVFLISACAFSAFVIYDMQQSRKKNAEQKAATEQAQQPGASEGKPLENFTPVETVTELQTTDIKVGEGAEVKPGDTVTVDYVGAIAATGSIFESSKDSGQPATFPLDGVIQGWTEGIPGMKEGGVRRLVIPADKAYGPNPREGSGIPPNAALVFDVTLIKVEAAQQPQQ